MIGRLPWALVPALALIGCRTTEAGGPEPSSLDRALDSIRPAAVLADVVFLAADELAGRDTPSNGQRIAARYVRNRLARLGLEPGAEDGWFHLWTLEQRELRAEVTELALVFEEQELPLLYGGDFAIHPSEIVDGAWEGDLVWCGSGSRRDMEGVDLAGRWALCTEEGESRTRRRRRVADAGGAGAIVIAVPDDDETTGERFSGWLERTARPAVRTPRNPGDRPPVFWVSEEIGARLLPEGRELELGAPLGVGLRADTDAYREVVLENVCAFWHGSDPELASEVILVSAHYDHIGVNQGGEVFNGADDNASGASALLALAEAFTRHGPFRRSVMLIWVSGEELGLLGSKAWAEDPWLPGGWRVICDLNLDMIGRNEPGRLEYTPTPGHERTNRLSGLLATLAAREGFDDLQSADKDFRRSDHYVFATELEVPILYVSGGEHEDYHRVTDTAEKIDSAKVARTARLVLRLIDALQEDELDLEAGDGDPPLPAQ